MVHDLVGRRRSVGDRAISGTKSPGRQLLGLFNDRCGSNSESSPPDVAEVSARSRLRPDSPRSSIHLEWMTDPPLDTGRAWKTPAGLRLYCWTAWKNGASYRSAMPASKDKWSFSPSWRRKSGGFGGSSNRRVLDPHSGHEVEIKFGAELPQPLRQAQDAVQRSLGERLPQGPVQEAAEIPA